LAQNCGADVIRVITELRAKHNDNTGKDLTERVYWGINGNNGKVDNMKTLIIWDTLSVKQQTLKTSIESACMLLRIDDVIAGIKKERDTKSKYKESGEEPQETFGDARDG